MVDLWQGADLTVVESARGYLGDKGPTKEAKGVSNDSRKEKVGGVGQDTFGEAKTKTTRGRLAIAQ